MNELILKIKMWWQPLPLREKRAVLIGGSCLLLFLIYSLIWSPLVHHAAYLRKQIVAEQKTLQFMQSAENEMKQSAGAVAEAPAVSSPVDFLSYLQQQLKETGLAQSVAQLKQSSQDTVTIKFQQVEFDRLMGLLISMMKAQRVSVEQLTSVATDMPGIANVDLILKLG